VVSVDRVLQLQLEKKKKKSGWNDMNMNMNMNDIGYWRWYRKQKSDFKVFVDGCNVGHDRLPIGSVGRGQFIDIE